MGNANQKAPKGLVRLHTARRSMAYIVWILLAVVVVVLLCALAFFTAERMSNLYILSTEGMSLRASYIIKGKENTNSESTLEEYFIPELLKKDEQLNGDTYRDYSITNVSYDLDIEKISVYPWSTTATVTALESASVKGTVNPDLIEQDKTVADYPVPEWRTVRYRIHFILVGERWYISELEVINDNPKADKLGTPDLNQTVLPMATPTPTREVIDLK